MEQEIIIHKQEILYDVENTLTKLTRTRQEANPGYNYNEINPGDGDMDRGLLLRSIEHSFDKAVGRVEAYVTGVSLVGEEAKQAENISQADTITELSDNLCDVYMLHDTVHFHLNYFEDIFLICFFNCKNMMLPGLPTDGSWKLDFIGRNDDGSRYTITTKEHVNEAERYSVYGNVKEIWLRPTNRESGQRYVVDFYAVSDSLSQILSTSNSFQGIQSFCGISYDITQYAVSCFKEGDVDRNHTTTYHLNHNDRVWIKDTEAMAEPGRNRYADLMRYKEGDGNGSSSYYDNVSGYINSLSCSYQVEDCDVTLPVHVDIVTHNVSYEVIRMKIPSFASFTLDLSSAVNIRSTNGKAGYIMLDGEGREISPSYYCQSTPDKSVRGTVVGQQIFVPICEYGYMRIGLSKAYHRNPVKLYTSLPIEYSYDQVNWTKVDPYGDAGYVEGYERECNRFPEDEHDWAIKMDLPDCISKSVPYLIDTMHRYITFKTIFEYLMVALPSEASPYLQLSEDCYKELKRIVSTRKAGLKRPPQPFERN